jgi:hypothetical protein
MDINFGEQRLFEVLLDQAHFDRACEIASQRALKEFGVDEFGHSDLVPGWERMTSCIEIMFASYMKHGCNHVYRFCAEAINNSEPEEDQ